MFPKRGKVLPKRSTAATSSAYRLAVSESLKAELGDTHQAIKTVRKWTGASERTVKNWFAARNSPGGEQLITLLRHSDRLLHDVLRLANRSDAIGIIDLVAAREALRASLQSIDLLFQDS
jgi:hypothetical protein